MTNYEKQLKIRRKITRLEKQIDALVKSQCHLEYSAKVDSEYSVLDSLCRELETARLELRKLDAPIVEKRLTFISMDLTPTVGDFV